MNIKSTLIISLFFSFVAYTASTHAQTYQASSRKHPVGLIELYTSQGCSSCPTAEKWLANIEKSGISEDMAIPLALHVDYWDYIGWEDQFSQKYFTKRQYKYHRIGSSSSVYTPQIMLNGEDVRRVNFKKSIRDLRNEKSPVDFSLNAQRVNNDLVKFNLTFNRIDTSAKNSNVIVVLAENNLVGEIASGENAGRTLKHQHVVRVWKNLGKINKHHSANLNIKNDWDSSNLELIVIVETDNLETQQTLRLALL